MSQNKEDLKKKIIYRASYRGTKEMDILMSSFVQFILKHIDDNSLKILDEFVNLNDETLISLKKGESSFNKKFPEMFEIIKKFKKFNI